jgi:hypothetical protein
MSIRHIGLTGLTCALAGMASALIAAPAATADPEVPPPPLPVIENPVQPPAATLAAPPADTLAAAPPAEVPHLSSPENLPPGTSDVPLDQQGRGLSYLRDLWHAVQTQDVSGRDALLLLTQRPMNPTAAPPPGVPAGPMPLAAPAPLTDPMPPAPPAPSAELLPIPTP